MLFDRCLSGSCSSTSRDIVVSGTGSGSAATGAGVPYLLGLSADFGFAGAGAGAAAAGAAAAVVLGGGTSGGASRTGGASEDAPQPMNDQTQWVRRRVSAPRNFWVVHVTARLVWLFSRLTQFLQPWGGTKFSGVDTTRLEMTSASIDMAEAIVAASRQMPADTPFHVKCTFGVSLRGGEAKPKEVWRHVPRTVLQLGLHDAD